MDLTDNKKGWLKENLAAVFTEASNRVSVDIERLDSLIEASGQTQHLYNNVHDTLVSGIAAYHSDLQRCAQALVEAANHIPEGNPAKLGCVQMAADICIRIDELARMHVTLVTGEQPPQPPANDTGPQAGDQQPAGAVA